jgi:rRNA maturation protein Rpf1
MIMGVLLTTSRNASVKTRFLSRELAESLPESIYFSRGKKGIQEAIDKARHEGKKLILLVQESNKKPSIIQLIKVQENDWDYGRQLKVKLIKLRKELINKRKKINSLRLELKTSRKLFKALGFSSGKDAEYSLVEKKGSLSFYEGLREIGPRFELKML